MIPKDCKRLAEVDFPIAEVSRHAAREKSIRHGHPSTLHLWWVHVVFTAKEDLAGILHSWKSYTANQANRLLGRSGEFWQREYYDHLIRDDEDFRRCVEYTLNNPVKAGLCESPEPWAWCGVGRLEAGATGEAPLVEFEVFEPKAEKDVPAGTVTRAKATCVACGAVLPPERVRAQLAAQRGGADVVFAERSAGFQPAKAGKMPAVRRTGGARMLAVVTLRAGESGRHYRLPAERDYEAVRKSHERLAEILDEWERGGRQGLCPVPDEPLPPIGTLGFRVQRYGMLEWRDLFTARQKVALVTIVRQIKSDSNEAASRLAALALGKTADLSNAGAPWKPGGECPVHMLSSQKIPP